MSLVQDHFDRVLRLDVERYLKGQGPRPVELASAPLLERWCVNLVYERIETASSVLFKDAMSLSGHVAKRPGLTDEVLVTMTILVWLDRNEKWARTKHRLYRLGSRSDVAD